MLPARVILALCVVLLNLQTSGCGRKEGTRYQGKPASEWTEQLKERDPVAEEEAIRAIGELGPEGGNAVPDLIQLLKDRNKQDVHKDAVEALGKIGPASKEAVPDIIRLLPHAFQHGYIGTVLVAFRGIGQEAVPYLIESMESDTNLAVRCWSARSLAEIRPVSPEAIDALVRASRDKNEYVRYAAAETLGAIGPDARAAIPRITEALNDESQLVREAAAKALKKIEVN